jgi:hypothetical protein
MIEQLAASFVIANDADRQDARTEVGEIADGVGGAARICFRAAVAKNQDRSFARDARDLAGNEFIEDEIAHDGNRLARKGSDEIEQAN